jgi:hypothetical protein
MSAPARPKRESFERSEKACLISAPVHRRRESSARREKAAR